MNDGLVSIITPMYNAGSTIERTILSVLSQTYEEFEMIIVDDKSDDEGPTIAMEYGRKDKRIIYIKSTEGLGVSGARNKAIDMSKGQYIAFLDSDDTWESDKLEVQLKLMKEKNAAFVFSGCDCVDSEDRFIKERKVPKKVDYKELLKGNVIPCLTVILDRRKIEDIKMERIHHEDYALWLSILKKGFTAYAVQRPLAHYRIGQTSVSSNKIKAAGWTFNIYRKHEKLGFIKSVYYFVNYMYRAFVKWR